MEPRVEGSSGDIDVTELLRTLWRRRLIVIGTVALITGLAVIVMMQLAPRFTAEARVMLDTRRQSVIDIESVLSGANPDAATVESLYDAL